MMRPSHILITSLWLGTNKNLSKVISQANTLANVASTTKKVNLAHILNKTVRDAKLILKNLIDLSNLSKIRKVKSLDLQPKQNNCKGQKTYPKKPDCFIRSVKVRKVNSLDHPKAPTTIVQVCPQSSKTLTGITALPDSGADVSIAGPKLLSQLKIPAKSLKKPETQVFASNGTKSNCTGYIKVMLRLGNKIVWDKIYICSEQNGLLLSWYTSKGLHILPGNYPCQIRSGNLGKSSSKPKFKSNHETHGNLQCRHCPYKSI